MFSVAVSQDAVGLDPELQKDFVDGETADETQLRSGLHIEKGSFRMLADAE
jgi:hypothetical protein